MDSSIRLLSISIAAIWVLRWAWRLLNWVYLRPRQLERLLREQGLTGNPYKLVFGDMIQAAQMNNQVHSKPMEFSHAILPYTQPFIYQSIQDHGENPIMWFGPIPVVTVTQPELIREVFSKVNDFPKPNISLVQILVPGLLSLNGEKWATRRKLINPAFRVDKLKVMMPMFVISCNEMMNKWEKMVTKSGSLELDLWPEFVSMTNDVISKATFSTSYKEGRRAFELLEDQTQIILKNMTHLFIPGWRYVPVAENRRFNKAQKQIRKLVKGIVDKRKMEMEGREEVKDDFLGTLMENQGGLTMEEVINECKTLYFAGQETTTVLLSYTMLLLAKSTHWQTKAREEVLNAFGKAAPDFDGLNKLKTVTMILNEVIRLYPPLPTALRKVERDTKLGEWYLPEGTYLNMSIIHSHHDPQHWGDNASEFNPNRFSRGILEATNKKFVFNPFASGPRVCVGQNLALMEAKMVTTMILQRFSFEPSPLYAHSPFAILTLRPQFGAHVILHQL